MSDRFGNIPIQPPESSPPLQKHTKKTHRVPAVTTSKGQRRSPIKAWGWIAAAVIIIALYSTLGFLGVPYYFSKILPDHFQEKTGMILEPTAVRFNPFSFRFETGEMRILSESGTSIMSLQSLFADVAPVALFRLSMVCNSVTISELDLNLAKELDGSYNFQQIFGPKKDLHPSDLLSLSNIPFFFALNNISITKSRIKFNDAPAGKTHTIEKIQLDLPTFSNTPFQTDQYLRPHFSAVVNGSPIELTGQAPMGESDGNDQTTKLSINIHDLDLTIYSGYLPFSLPMDFKKGRADGKIELFFDPRNNDGDKLSIDFQLQVSGAELIRKNESIIIAIPTARLSGNLQPVSRKLHLTEITVKEPTISSFGEDFPGNIKQLLKQDGQTTPPGSVEVVPYSLRIDLLLVDNAIVRFYPKKNDQKPASSWKSIQLSAKNYHSKMGSLNLQKGGSLSFSGEKDGSLSTFSWQGSFYSTDSLTGDLSLKKIDCNDLLRATGANHPFKLTGVADLKGQLVLYSRKGQQSPLSYKLIDAEISIEDFALTDKGKSILAAPVVKLAPLNLEDESINFGNVQFQKGTALFTYGKLPELFTTFNSNKYRLQGIDFEGKVTVNSQNKSGSQLTFNNVSLKTNELDSSRKTSNNLSISGTTKTGGIFRAQGDVALAPFTLAINTGFRELPLQKVLPFFTKSPLLSDLQGNLSGKGLFKLPAMGFSGEIQLTDFSRRSPKMPPFSWQKSVFQDLDYTAKPFHLGITSAEIDQARFSWKITETDNGPMHYLQDFFQNYLSTDDYLPTDDKRPPDDKRSPDETRITISPVDIREISFTNSKINIHDNRLTPDWKAEVTDFAGKIKDIHKTTATSKSVFSFTGKLDDTPFAIKGEIDPFAQKTNGTFHFSLENYPLASFHKQLLSETDLDTSNGEFKLTLDCTWQDQQYMNSGTIDLIDIDLIDIEPPATTSDLALPLALLRGTDDTLQLRFDFLRTAPVAKTSLFDELLTSFQRQIIKGSVSPLLLATGDFTDLIGNEFIEFQPGEFMLSEPGRKVLTRYATLLIAHPHVGLVLSGGIDKRIDSMGMKERLKVIEQQRVEKENEKLFLRWQEKKTLYEKSLEEHQDKAETNDKFIEQDIPTEILTGFTPIQPAPIVIDEAMLLELAQKRIDILYQYFTDQFALQPGRLSIVKPDSLAGESERPTNGVIITLKAINR
ncbi:MAG: DUF748 domain-containing protein [Desulforhopalus sp.]|nr:DUF748 domain-containing protein [Desulforhopalus sp.]